MKTKEEEKIYYVSMTDRYMNGWGEAKGRRNKLVFECKSFEEAKIVRDNAHERIDMKYINICANKPYYNQERYYPQYYTKADYCSWYVKNYFRDRNRIE
jgi:hypothetical protein